MKSGAEFCQRALSRNVAKSESFSRAILYAFALILAAMSSWQPVQAKSGIKTEANQVFGNNGQKLDLYFPTKNARKTAVLFVHGGGFTSGSKKDMAGHAKLHAKGGFVTATLNYRLTPAFPAPAAVNDVNDAVDWLKARPGVSRVVVVGYSAGGTLALMSGLSRRGSVAAIISVAGVSDLGELKASTSYEKLKTDITAYVGQSPPAAVSPIAQQLSAAPPVFLIHGQEDVLVPVAQSVKMAERLRDAKANVLLKVVPGIGHEVFLPNPRLAEILLDVSRYLVAVDSQ